MKYLLNILFVLSFTFCHAADISKAAKSNNAIASGLYRELSAQEGNLFFSPFSLSSALSMPYIGAREVTEEQMAEVLHFDADPEENARNFGALTQHLISGCCTSAIEVSNSLWIQEDYYILPQFLAIATKELQAGVQSVNYLTDTEKAIARINSFVESATHGHIKKLLEEGTVTSDTRAVIINTIYLKSAWQNPFDPEQTTSQPFYAANGEAKEVPMMHGTNSYLIKKTKNATLLELPYYTGRCGLVNLACYILLPDEGVPSSDVEANLEDFASLNEGMSSNRVAVTLPKFSLETTMDIKENLEKMGLSLPFSSEADFSGITGSHDLFISKVVQKAKVSFTEEGTEAAAATGIIMNVKCILDERDPVSFIADRPFVFVIADKTSQSLLFVGRLSEV